jgi:tetratricopeptide (TPR) repeat protein
MLPVFSCRRLLMFLAAVAVAVSIASPAFAQTTGMVKGKIVDEKGQPIEAAKVTITSLEQGVNRSFTVNTKKNGDYAQVGIPPGQYRVTAEKDKIGSQSRDVKVRLGDPTEMNFTLTAGATAASKEQAQKAAQVQGLFDAGVAASKANDYDTAITKFQDAIALLPNCYDCYYNIGQANAQKKDYAKSEEAFKKAIELKADYADAYNGLATIYNAQKKFDDAAAASQKAAELAAAPGAGGATAGGGGNVNALYNLGVIAWNAGKAEDAKAKFEEALKADPNHAASHYQLAMCLVNLGKLPEAASEFDTYLKLAPDGEFAAQAKAIVASLPKK